LLYDAQFQLDEIRAARRYSLLLPNPPYADHIIATQSVQVPAGTIGATHAQPLGGLRVTNWVTALAATVGAVAPPPPPPGVAPVLAANYANLLVTIAAAGPAAAAAANGLYQVSLDRRLQSPPAFAGPHKFKHALELSFVAAGGAGGFPAYFLPWDAYGGVVHMTIPGGGVGPRHFFTAALSGCSIMVSGPPNNPTVYHCGADAWGNCPYTQAPFINPAPAPNVSPQIWHDLVVNVAGLGVAFQAIDKTNYIVDFIGAGGTARSRLLEPQLRLRKFDNTAVALPWGAVFGLRDPATNNWSFYLQENVDMQWNKTTRHVRGPAGVVLHDKRRSPEVPPHVCDPVLSRAGRASCETLEFLAVSSRILGPLASLQLPCAVMRAWRVSGSALPVGGSPCSSWNAATASARSSGSISPSATSSRYSRFRRRSTSPVGESTGSR